MPCYGIALRALRISVFALLSLTVGRSADLKQTTLDAWNIYTHNQQLQDQQRAAKPDGFLWAEGSADRLNEIREGHVVVSAVGDHNPQHVPNGLIHHWVGAAFIPYATAADVLAITRDYAGYKNYYRPAVADAKPVSSTDNRDQFIIWFVNNSVLTRTSLEGDYVSQYFQVDDHRWYSISTTTSMREVKDYGSPGEQCLPPDEGSGYIWRLYSTARLEERDGGVYVEVEAIALSRDVPGSLRWLVDPIVRRVSRESLEKSLRETANAVRNRTQTVAQASR